MVLSSVSVNVVSCDVGVSNVFFSRSTAPAGARPVSTECLAASAVFSCARKYASRLPPLARSPLPSYSATVSANGGWKCSGPISNVKPRPPVA